MKKLLEDLRKQYDTKAAERDAILKDPAIDITGIEKADAINVELKTIQENIQKTAKTLEDTEASRKFAETPVIDLDLKDGQKIVGVVDTGDGVEAGTEKGKTVLENVGRHGLIDVKMAKMICSKDYEDAFATYVRSAGNLGNMSGTQLKILQEGTDSAGGFFVPDTWLSRMIMKEPAPTRVNGRVTQITISGDSVVLPRVVYSTDDIYTTGIRVTLTGERPTSSTVHRVTDPVFGQLRMNVGTYMMSLPLTNDIIEDANFPLRAWCAERFRETIDLLYDNQLLNGTGVGVRPHGILRNPGGTDEPARTLSSTANDIDADQLRGLPFDVPEQYINDNTTWVMNRSSCGKKIAQMKDGSNRYLFLDGQTFPGLVGRTPDTLVGYPIIYSAFMPDIGDGAYPMIFGDLRGSAKVTRVGFSIKVLEERYAEDNYVVLLGRLRWGGGLLEPFRLRIGKSDNA